jgi:hypothetical protein
MLPIAQIHLLAANYKNAINKYTLIFPRPTLEIALVSLPVIFLQMLAANAVEDGGSSLITVFKPVNTK